MDATKFDALIKRLLELEANARREMHVNQRIEPDGARGRSKIEAAAFQAGHCNAYRTAIDEAFAIYRPRCHHGSDAEICLECAEEAEGR